MTKKIKSEIDYFLTHNAQKNFKPIIEKWLKEMSPEIENSTNEICDKYHIPRTSLKIAYISNYETDNVKELNPQIQFVEGFSTLIGTIVAAVISVIMTVIGGGSGVALFASGPLGWVIGAFFGLIYGIAAGIGMKEKLKEWTNGVIKNSNMPKFIRGKLITEKKLIIEIDKVKDDFRNDMINSMKKEFESDKKLYEIIDPIKDQLIESAQNASLLIQ